MPEEEVEISIEGPVPAEVIVEFGELGFVVEPVSTVLLGRVGDDAALHGILERLRGLGLHVVEIRRTTTPRAPRQAPDV